MAQNTQEVNSLSVIAALIVGAVVLAGPAMKILGPLGLLAIFAGLILVVALIGLRVVDQYERGIVLTLGKYSGIKQVLYGGLFKIEARFKY